MLNTVRFRNNWQISIYICV